MLSSLGKLQILPEELENLIDIDISTSLALSLHRIFILKNFKLIPSMLLINLFVFLLSSIFIMPISLILIRNSNESLEDQAENTLLVIMIVILLLISLWNLYLWRRAKQIKSLSRLVDKVHKYNSVVQAIELLENLELQENSDNTLCYNELDEVIEALTITRKSLINALKIEKIIRNNQRFIQNRSQLFANIQDDLETLMNFEISNQASEYCSLLNESLQIGLSVHREVLNLQNHRF